MANVGCGGDHLSPTVIRRRNMYCRRTLDLNDLYARGDRLGLARALAQNGLDLKRDRAIAKSGTIDWVDPLVGGRVQVEVAPEHELFVRGDVGGFGVGS